MKNSQSHVAESVTAMVDSARRADAGRTMSNEALHELERLFNFFDQSIDERGEDYARVIRGLGGPLLSAVIDHSIDTRTYLPRPAELRKDVETVRDRWLEQHPWRPCARCEATPRWITVAPPTSKPLEQLVLRDGKPVIENGEPVLRRVQAAPTVVPCPCWPQWQNHARAIGALAPAPSRPSLPAAAAEFTNTGALAERFRSRLRVVAD
jgi:hypothetical protein